MPPDKLTNLRELLAHRFPTVPCGTGDWADGRITRVLPTGIPAIDSAAGGLPLSAVTELVCTAPSCGSQSLLGELLAVTRSARTRVALVDGSDSFDPSSFRDDLLTHLLWVRCRSREEAMHVVDLVARDANLGLVLLDLRRASEGELRKTPATQWYRLQRAVESTDLALVVQTPRPSVPSAKLRLRLEIPLPTAALDRDRHELATALAPTLQRQRIQAAG